MTIDDMIILRVFEYGFQSAMASRTAPDRLDFPEPAVIYLNRTDGIPKESTLHISFGSQGSFDYKVKNFLYLAHDTAELNRKKMAILIPFQALRLRNLLQQLEKSPKNSADFDTRKILRLQEDIKDDIISSIKLNHKLGNITTDDAGLLFELANQLYEHICEDFRPVGGEEIMKPLLPGALELPNDKYRFRIDELEKQIEQYAGELAKYRDEHARFADENARLKERISELEKQQM